MKLKKNYICCAKKLSLNFCWLSTNKITCTQHHHIRISHSSCHVQRVLVVATLVITGALIARTVTQRAMGFRQWWYLFLLHLIIQSLIHIRFRWFFNRHPDLHRTQRQSHKIFNTWSESSWYVKYHATAIHQKRRLQYLWIHGGCV